MSKEFKINFEPGIEAAILNTKNNFEDGMYWHYYESAELSSTDKPLTKEEYMSNVDQFLADYKTSIVDTQKIIDEFPRKKNGSFNRKNVQILASCDNSIYICEWHNTWIYYQVVVKASDDYTLNVFLREYTDTPG